MRPHAEVIYDLAINDWAINEIFSNKCEVREGELKRKREGRGRGAEWPSKSPLCGSWWCKSWSIWAGGSPRNTETTRFMFVHSQVKKSRYLLWGRNFTLDDFDASDHRTLQQPLKMFSDIFKDVTAAPCISKAESIVAHYRGGYLQAMCEYWKTTICHRAELICSVWSTPTSTALLDTGWNAHFYYELRVMCQQPSVLQCCSILKGTAAQRSQFNTVLETESLGKKPQNILAKVFNAPSSANRD